MKEKTCCFTGHRKIPSELRGEIFRRLKQEIIKLVLCDVRYFGVGGSWGFDILAARAVLELKEIYPYLKLILVLPCAEHNRFWADENKIIYEQIKKCSDKIVHISSQYTSDCMMKRNRHMVDSAQYCICYLTRLDSGTGYTVRYAEEKGLRVINIAK